MRVLVTGAAGIVAGGVVRALGRYCKLRLLDPKRPAGADEHEYLQGSILDADVLAGALEGVEGVVNLAIAKKSDGREPATGDYFDVNIKGLYLLMDAAAAAGVKAFVHVSSTAHVIGHWYAGERLGVDSSLTTRGRYSLTKALQEAICEHFSRNSRMRIVALRLASPCEAGDVYAQAAEGRDVYNFGLIDTEDFGEACRAALEAENLGAFEVFHCVATPEARERFDADRTQQLLGWRPKYDFADLAPG